MEEFEVNQRIQHHDGEIGYYVKDWTTIYGELHILAVSHVLDVPRAADPSVLLYKWKKSQCRSAPPK